METNYNENHCCDCGIHRKDMDEIPWGTRIEGSKEWGIRCKPCAETRRLKEIEDFQASETDTTYIDDVICPHCGCNHSQGDPENAFYEEGDHDMTCVNCGLTYELQTSISYTYSTYKETQKD